MAPRWHPHLRSRPTADGLDRLGRAVDLLVRDATTLHPQPHAT